MMLLEWPVGARSRGTHSTNCPSSFSAPPSSLVLVLLLLLLGPCSDSGVIRIVQGVSRSSLPCHDWRNQLVRDGDEFIPDKNEPCRVCLCNGGVHTTCNMKPCPPPACYRLEEVKNICCEYRCLDAGLDNIHHNKTGDKNAIGNVKRRSDDDIADQGLRLAASTVTSFLVLALLLFMVHRLCQRRHLIQMRRLNAPRNHHDDDNDNNPFSQDAFSIGMPCPPPYDCPPPPYTPPKPFAYIQPCEAPPPYEEVQNQMASNNPAFSGSLSPTSRTTDPSDCNSAQEPGSVSSMPGLGLGGIAPDNQTGSIDMEDNSSIHETTPKTPFGADEGQFTTSSFTVSAHSPTMNRPFSTFFGSCTVNENSNGNGRVVRNSCGSIAARAERIRSCLFPSGKDHQDGVALGLTSQQAMAALSLRETGEETLPSKAEMFAPWYIKRSESIEIRRESRSPRNSYCFRNNYAPSDSSESESESEMPDMSSSWLKGSGNSTSMGLTATSPQSHTHPAGSNLSSFKPNNSRVANPQSSDCCNPRRMSENSGNSFANGGIKPTKAEGHKQVTPGRPVRISYVDSCKSSLNNNNNNNNHTPTATTPTAAPTRCLNSPDNNGREHSEFLNSGISKFDSANQLANSSFVQSQEFGMNPSTLRIRNSLPPLELKALQPEMRKMETLTRSSAITPPSALALSIVAGASAGGLLSVEHADDSHSERNFWNFHHPANLLNGRLQSPGTPVSSGSSPSRISIGMLQDRSNSLTSDISLFSICSETGEKKRTKEISSSCNSTSTIATTPTATTTTDICNNNNNNSNNNNLNNNNNNNNNNSGGGGGGPPIKNDVPYPDLFQANSSSSNGGGGGVGGAIGGGGGAGGGGPHSSNQVTADANQMPLPRRETMTTASLVSNILKRYSDVPRQSMEHDENSYCKPSSSSTSSSSSSSSSSNTVSLVANQQQQQQQQPQAQHLHTQSQQQQQQPQAQHLHTQNQQQQQQPQAQHLHTQNQQQQPQAQHLHTQNQQQQPQAQHLHIQNQQQQPQAQHLHTQNLQQQPQQHLHQKQEQQHNNNNNNSHNNYHNKTSSSNNNNSAHHNNNNNSSHYYHHHHHRSNRNTDSGPASSPLVGNSGASTGSGGGGSGGAMGGDCAFAQPYPRKSEIRTLDHRSSNRKSIDDVIRTIDITPVLQSIAKPLDNTAREGSSREVSEGGGGSKTRFSALECGVGKHFLSAGFPFGDKPPPPPPPPLPMFPKPKSSPADRKKRHSVATNGGNVSKQSKTKLSTAAKGVAGKFHEDIGISTNGMKGISSGAALLENMKESINNAGSSSKSESSPNRGCKSRSGSNGSGNNPNTAGHHRTACEPCFKLYGYVDDPSVLYNCCHRMETDKEIIIDRYKNTSVDKNPPPNNNISPAMMKYLTSSPKSSDNGPQSTSYTAAVDSAGSCVGGGGIANANSGNTGHSSMYRPKKQSQLRTSPEHKSKSGSSVAYKASAGAVGNYATLNSHSHPSQNANTQKKRHGRSKDKNRKSYPGASPEGAPRGSYAGASPEGGAPRETKIVSNPWLTTSSSGASASSASPARRKFEKTHRSKHHNSVILDMSRTYTDDCQVPQNSGGRHGNQVLNHVDQLSSYV